MSWRVFLSLSFGFAFTPLLLLLCIPQAFSHAECGPLGLRSMFTTSVGGLYGSIYISERVVYNRQLWRIWRLLGVDNTDPAVLLWLSPFLFPEIYPGVFNPSPLLVSTTQTCLCIPFLSSSYGIVAFWIVSISACTRWRMYCFLVYKHGIHKYSRTSFPSPTIWQGFYWSFL